MTRDLPCAAREGLVNTDGLGRQVTEADQLCCHQ
jgi:hypothetical protein